MLKNIAGLRSGLRFAPQISKNLIGGKIAPVSSVGFVRFNSTNHKLNTDSRAFKYSQEGPLFLKFTEEHEWLAVHKDDTAFIGITLYASDSLGDATFIELPEVGDRVEVGDSIGSVESVKSASEIYSPVAGEVVAVNETLESSPQLINEDPQGEAWIAHIKLNETADVVGQQENLLSAEEYEALLQEH